MNIRYLMVFAIILISTLGISGLAMADTDDARDMDLILKYWKKKIGNKQYSICTNAKPREHEILMRCGEQLWEHCWEMQPTQLALKCRGFANMIKYDQYVHFMERAVNRGDRREYRYYEDKFTSVVAENYQLAQAHAQSEGSQLTEKKQMDSENNSNQHFERGSKNQEAGNYKDAIIDYSNHLKLYPNRANTYYNRGNCYYKLNNPEKALSDYSKAIEINPKDPDFYSMRGSVHQDLGKFKEAIADYTKELELGHHDAAIFYNRADCYFMLKNFQAAVSDYTKAIELKPDDADIYLSRAAAYENLAIKNRAIADYKKASELGSKDAQTRLTAIK